MLLRTFVLGGIIGTVGFAAGRLSSRAERAVPMMPAMHVLASERPSAPDRHEPVAITADHADDVDDRSDDGSDDDDVSDDRGDDVGDLLAAAEQHVEGLRRAHSAILGRVSDKHTGAPLIGVTVVASSGALAGERTAITDEHGNYELTALPAGNYLLTFYYNEVTEGIDGVIVSELDATHVNDDFDPQWQDAVSFTGTEDMENSYIIDGESLTAAGD